MSEVSAWYAIVDGAADARLYKYIAQTQDHACLYYGEYSPETKTSLPYVVRMKKGERFSEIWSSNESGNYWGILCQTRLTLKQLKRHLRRFTTARLPKGDIVLFRFWDPRVFVPFVENGLADEISPFFEGVDNIVADLGKMGRKRYNWETGLQQRAL